MLSVYTRDLSRSHLAWAVGKRENCRSFGIRPSVVRAATGSFGWARYLVERKAYGPRASPA